MIMMLDDVVMLLRRDVYLLCSWTIIYLQNHKIRTVAGPSKPVDTSKILLNWCNTLNFFTSAINGDNSEADKWRKLTIIIGYRTVIKNIIVLNYWSMRAAKYVGKVISNNISSIPPLTEVGLKAWRLDVLFNYNFPRNYPSGLFCLRHRVKCASTYIYIQIIFP